MEDSTQRHTQKKINVLHLIAGDLNGGAAKGAYWLHLGLLKAGVDSYILTTGKHTFGEDRISSISQENDRMSSKTKKFIEKKITKNALVKGELFSTGFFGVEIENNKLYKSADIIHLHWINSNFISINTIKKIDKPIVWTMRDMWPFTGGCHYTMECGKYLTGCSECPLLNSKIKKDFSYFVSFLKSKYILRKNITYVAISDFIKESASSSKLLRNENIIKISNCIDTEKFQPIKKETARDILGLKADKKIILIGSTRLKDKYKGSSFIFEAIKHLDREKYKLLIFGASNEKDFSGIGIDYIRYGYLHDTTTLRLLYSAADVFVSTSIQDAFAKTLVESMACGTPVVCFDTAGPSEIVEHLKTGYKAKPYNAIDIARGIELICCSENYSKISEDSVNRAVNNYSKEIAGEKYHSLYKIIMSEH